MYATNEDAVVHTQMTELKIAHVQHPYIPDVGYQENHLPREQNQLGHDARIFTSTRIPREEESASLGKYEYRSVKTYRLPTGPSIYSIGNVSLKGLNELLNRFDPDIIHSHGLHSLLTLQSLRYTMSNSNKLFVDFHVDNDNFHIDTLAKRVGHQMYKVFFAKLLEHYTDYFLPVNPFAEDLLISEYGISAENIELLPLGVDTDTFAPDHDTARLESELGVTNGPVLISSGNINSTKDTDVLIRAFKRTATEYPNATLLIVGPIQSDYRDELRTLSRNMGLEDRIQFTGEVPHEKLAKYYNLADVGIWPGKLGITIIEAIGCGLPIIVCESTATEFLIKNNNGDAIERGDQEAIAQMIDRLLTNTDLSRRYSDNAVEYAQSDLSWRKIAERSIELYQGDYRGSNNS